MLGSVAERIVAKAPCPVLTVPGRTAAGAPVHTGPFTRVLCAIDFSPASLAALAHVRVLGAADGRVTLLHVVEPAPMLEPAAMSSPGALEYLQVTANIVRARLHERAVPELGRRGEIDEMVRSGKPYSEILRAAEQVKADLIVMGAHGGLRGLIAFGSTATHVVRQASCPVLTIKG
jgi:nucleotide-binding universal stress UspA family protein